MKYIIILLSCFIATLCFAQLPPAAMIPFMQTRPAAGPTTPTVYVLATNTASSLSDPQTFTITTSKTLANGYAVVTVGCWASSPSITGATFDGSTMTSLTSALNGSSSHITAIFGLPLGSKVAGTYTISVNLGAAGYEGSLGCIILEGVNQSASTGTPQTTTPAGTSASVTLTSATGELCIASVAADDLSASTMSAGQVNLTVGINSGLVADARTSSEAGAASVTMSYSLVGAAAMAAIPFKP